MTESMLSNVDKYLASGKYIGGVNGKFERISLGIFLRNVNHNPFLSTELYL